MAGNGLVGKRISVFFNDGIKITRHDGVCTANSDIEIELNSKEIISKRNVIRIEVQ